MEMILKIQKEYETYYNARYFIKRKLNFAVLCVKLSALCGYPNIALMGNRKER
jgi:hypothetical protein